MTMLWAIASLFLMGALAAIIWHSPIVLLGLVVTLALLFAGFGMLSAAVVEVERLGEE